MECTTSLGLNVYVLTNVLTFDLVYDYLMEVIEHPLRETTKSILDLIISDYTSYTVISLIFIGTIS